MSTSVISTGKRGPVVILEHGVDVDGSPEEVFDYCSDPTHEPEWNPKLRRVTKLTDGPDSVGTRYEMEFVPGDPMRVECVRFERPTAWATVGDSRRLKAYFACWVRATADGAHLVMRMELLPQGLFAFAAPLLRRYMQGQQERNVTTIKAMLEGRGR